MSIRDTFPKKERILSDEPHARGLPESRTMGSIGLLLSGGNVSQDWLRINFREPRIAVTINSTTNGGSAARQDVIIPFGEEHVFGRNNFPYLKPDVSREHVILRPVKIRLANQAIRPGVEIVDQSTYGSSVWTRPANLEDYGIPPEGQQQARSQGSTGHQSQQRQNPNQSRAGSSDPRIQNLERMQKHMESNSLCSSKLTTA